MDRTGGTWPLAGYGRLLLKTLMGSGRVVVFDEGSQNPTQVTFVEDQNVVETLFAHDALPAFGKSIGIGGLKRDRNDVDML